MRLKVTLILLILLLVPTHTIPAPSESSEKFTYLKWEWTGLVNLQLPSVEMVYSTAFTPSTVLTNMESDSASASQLMKARGDNDRETGFFLGLNYLISSDFGVQVLGLFHEAPADRFQNVVSTRLQYNYFNVPKDQPAAGEGENIGDLRTETQGDYQQGTFCLNVLSRLSLTGSVTAQLTGGLTFFYFGGELQPLDNLSWPQEETTLYSITDRLLLEVMPSLSLGVNLGLDLNLKLARSMALLLTARYVWGSNIASATKITGFIDSHDWREDIYLEKFKASMPFPVIEINPSFFSLGAILKIRFK